jgi:hypothetical protein
MILFEGFYRLLVQFEAFVDGVQVFRLGSFALQGHQLIYRMDRCFLFS